MKKIFALTLLVSTGAFAHTQTPSVYGGKNDLQEAISLTDTKTVYFNIGNLGKEANSFEVTVDDCVVDKTRILYSGQSQRIGVVLNTIETKKPVTYIVCSKSTNDDNVKTRICSKVQLVRL